MQQEKEKFPGIGGGQKGNESQRNNYVHNDAAIPGKYRDLEVQGGSRCALKLKQKQQERFGSARGSFRTLYKVVTTTVSLPIKRKMRKIYPQFRKPMRKHTTTRDLGEENIDSLEMSGLLFYILSLNASYLFSLETQNQHKSLPSLMILLVKLLLQALAKLLWCDLHRYSKNKLTLQYYKALIQYSHHE